MHLDHIPRPARDEPDPVAVLRVAPGALRFKVRRVRRRVNELDPVNDASLKEIIDG
jgi:hypothetical protein